MKYSVLLAYPTAIADEFWETYFTSVEAEDGQGAVKKAQQEVIEVNGLSEDGYSLEEFEPILVIKGEHPAEDF